MDPHPGVLQTYSFLLKFIAILKLSEGLNIYLPQLFLFDYMYCLPYHQCVTVTCSNEGLTPKTSASLHHCGGNVSIINLIATKFLFHFPTDLVPHSFVQVA